MGGLKIIIYTDSKYEYQADALIESLHLNGHGDIKVIYYTVGFVSNIFYPNLEKKYWELNPNFERFPFYKPEICLDALINFGGNILFLDSDILIGKRFKPGLFIHANSYPLLSIGNWEFPFYYNTLDPHRGFPRFQIGDRVVLDNKPIFGNIETILDNDSYLISFDNLAEPTITKESELSQMVIKDYSPLMKYYGVKSPTMEYVYSCCVSFNVNCEGFIREWKSITENEYLRRFGREYYPIAEETSINVTLWKNKVSENYGRIFVNTLHSETVKYVESSDHILRENIFGDPLQKCEDSSKILFYHGMIDPMEIENTLGFLRSRV